MCCVGSWDEKSCSGMVDELRTYRTDILALYRQLINHLRYSPVFYHGRPFPLIKNRLHDYETEGTAFYAAFDGTKMIGMMISEPVDIPMFDRRGYARKNRDHITVKE
jgi:hypothetical protein